MKLSSELSIESKQFIPLFDYRHQSMTIGALLAPGGCCCTIGCSCSCSCGAVTN